MTLSNIKRVITQAINNTSGKGATLKPDHADSANGIRTVTSLREPYLYRSQTFLDGGQSKTSILFNDEPLDEPEEQDDPAQSDDEEEQAKIDEAWKKEQDRIDDAWKEVEDGIRAAWPELFDEEDEGVQAVLAAIPDALKQTCKDHGVVGTITSDGKVRVYRPDKAKKRKVKAKA